MNVMRRFTLRSLRQNRRRTVVTIIGVILSVSMITAVSALAASFIDLFQRDAIATNGSWHVKIPGVRAEKIPEVLEDSGVDECSFGREVGYTPFQDTDGRYLFLMQYTRQGFDQMSVRLLCGRLPENGGEVAVSQSILIAGMNLQVGDTLTLQNGQRRDAQGELLTGNPALDINTREDGVSQVEETFVPGEAREYTVVGIIDRPIFEQSWSAGYGVLGFLDLTALSAQDTVDAYYTAKPVNRDLYGHGQVLAAKVGVPEDDADFNTSLLMYYGVMGTNRQELFFTPMLLVLILLIAAASATLIYNAFAISVAERARQLGLLSSVGATIAQKRAAIYFEGFVIAVLGIPLGILAGLAGIAVTVRFLRPLLSAVFYTNENVQLVLRMPLWAVGVTVFFSLVTIFLSVVLPAQRASRITPMEAIRLTREVKLTPRDVRTSRLTTRIFGFEAALARKNIKRNRRKGRATTVSLAMSLVLFLTVSQYISLIRTTAGAMDEGYNYDIVVSFGSGIPDKALQHAITDMSELTQARKVQTVDSYWCDTSLKPDQFTVQTRSFLEIPTTGSVPYRLQLAGLGKEDFEAYAASVNLDPAPYEDPGRLMGILINHGQTTEYEEDGSARKAVGDVLNMSPGDALPLSSVNGEDSWGLRLTIGALKQERPMGIENSPFSYVTLIMSQPAFDQAVAWLTGGNAAMEPTHNVYLLASGDDQLLESQVNSLLKGSGLFNYYLYNIFSATRTQQNRSLFLGVLIYGFITLITLICIANILNTVSTGIALRRQEFAMLRSVGMAPRSFRKMIRYESVFFSLKGLLYGLPVSLITAFLLFKINTQVISFTFTLPWESYFFAIVLMLAITLSTMLYATAKVRKENIVDALKEENI